MIPMQHSHWFLPLLYQIATKLSANLGRLLNVWNGSHVNPHAERTGNLFIIIIIIIIMNVVKTLKQ